MAGEQIRVEYIVSGKNRGVVLNLALVQDALVNEVTSGENAGRRLAHDRVVRAYETLDPGTDQTGSTILIVPEGFDASRAAVVGYAQDSETLRIVGASTTSIDPEKASLAEEAR